MRIPGILALAAVLAVLAVAGTAAATCTEESVLTLAGVDTREGRVLFSVGTPGAAPALLVLTPDETAARLYPLPAEPRVFGGSVGPGPVFSFGRCGERCLQTYLWSEGRLEPLGGPLEVPSDATVHGTYDSEGRPWVVFHRLLEPAGPIEDALSAPPAAIRAHAFRLAGESWADRGELRVQSVGSPGATPAPQAADGILSGTGLFTAGRPPSSWVASVPKLSREHTAQILPLASQSGAAVLYTAAGDLMLTTDRGRTWQRSDWRPLNPASADLELDLPQGDRRGAFYALWIERRPFDREVPEILHLTELTAGPRWQVVEKLPSSVILDTGRQLNFNHVLVPRAGAWMLVASCATSEAGPGVVVRMRELGKLGPTKFLLIR